jgi:hypothetical protein
LTGLKARKISLQEVDGGDRGAAGQIMALIKSFEHKSMDRNSIHDAIDATYTTFERDGRRFLQIDSYGRAAREMPGKKSQSIQLDEKSARELFDILRDAFGFR